MTDRVKIIERLNKVSYYFKSLLAVGWQGDADVYREHMESVNMALSLLKEQEQTAKWLWDRPHHFKCSNCEWISGVSATMYSFCPNCGKKMEMSAGELMKEWPNSEVINV